MVLLISAGTKLVYEHLHFEGLHNLQRNEPFYFLITITTD